MIRQDCIKSRFLIEVWRFGDQSFILKHKKSNKNPRQSLIVEDFLFLDHDRLSLDHPYEKYKFYLNRFLNLSVIP